MKINRNLNGVRGFWILTIVLAHYIGEWAARYGQSVPQFPVNGETAANGFFVLSGFLVSVRYADSFRHGNLLRQSAREYTRHYKKLWLFNLIGQLPYLIWYAGTTGELSLRFAGKAAMNLLLIQNWIPYKNYTFNPVCWFLSILMFCYVITPFAFRILSILREKAGMSDGKKVDRQEGHIGLPAVFIDLLLLALLFTWLFFCEKNPALPNYKNVLFHAAMYLIGAIAADPVRKVFRIKNSRNAASASEQEGAAGRAPQRPILCSIAGLIALASGYLIPVPGFHDLFAVGMTLSAVVLLAIGSDLTLLTGPWFAVPGRDSLSLMVIHPLGLLLLNNTALYALAPDPARGLVLLCSVMAGSVAMAFLLADILRRRNSPERGKAVRKH